MRHYLKTWTQYFDRVLLRDKNFEVRRNNRDYQRGDVIVLQDFDPESQQYSGREIVAEVSYVLLGGQFGIEKGFVVMGLKNIEGCDNDK